MKKLRAEGLGINAEDFSENDIDNQDTRYLFNVTKTQVSDVCSDLSDEKSSCESDD